MTTESLYDGREQTLVKHLILKNYLERFAYIIGSWSDSITYIDCFSGPWESRSQEHSDTSFDIAIQQLRKARDELAVKSKRHIRLRCCFIEENRAAFAKLRAYSEKIDDVEICTCHGRLEDSVPEIVRFVKNSGKRTFPFVFVDPKGWTGFSLEVIRPLLTLSPCEILINFMTEHIRRFIEMPDPKIQEGFVRLFGDASFLEVMKREQGLDRDDACIEKYTSIVQQAGNFSWASSAIVLKSVKDRSHFHLIYLTRNAKGIEVFKDAERKSMTEMETARANAQQKARVTKSQQKELFDAQVLHDSSYLENLRTRYRSRARRQLEELLIQRGRLLYDNALACSLRQPLVCDKDVKDWIKQWVTSGQATIEGLGDREKSLKRGANHSIIWKNSDSSPSASTPNADVSRNYDDFS